MIEAVPAVGDAVRPVAHRAGEAGLFDGRPFGWAEQFDRFKSHGGDLAAEVLESHFCRFVLAGVEEAAVAPGGDGMMDVAFQFWGALGFGGEGGGGQLGSDHGCGRCAGEGSEGGPAGNGLFHWRQVIMTVLDCTTDFGGVNRVAAPGRGTPGGG